MQREKSYLACCLRRVTANFKTIRVRPDPWVMTHIALLNCTPGMEGIHLIPRMSVNVLLLHHAMPPRGVQLSPPGTQRCFKTTQSPQVRHYHTGKNSHPKCKRSSHSSPQENYICMVPTTAMWKKTSEFKSTLHRRSVKAEKSQACGV